MNPNPGVRQWPGRALLVAVLATLALAACKSKPPPVEIPKPIIATVSIVAAQDLNPNRDGRPSPVFVRLYLLRDGGKFLAADFDEVTAKADQVLAAALVGRNERMVEPGSAVKITLEVPPEARMLGVVAEFADMPDSRWRAVTPTAEGGLLPQFKGHTLLVSVGRRSVSAEFIPEKAH